MMEDNLGLVSGSVDASEIGSMADEVASYLEGTRTESPDPTLEKRLLSFLREMERSELEKQGYFVRKMKWPNGSPFAICLTHDVDNIERALGHVLKTRSRFKAGDLINDVVGIASLYDNVDEIAKREGGMGFRSSFYFLTSNYPLEEIATRIKKLRDKGWDIGLHGDFGTHDSPDKMREAVEVFSTELGFSPRGVREHFLKFSHGTTWEIMENAGFDYDTTVGLNDRLGFKLGLATPFHPPTKDWRPMRLLEIPLILMDTTLWGYLKRDETAGLNDIRGILSKVQEVGGLFTLLWHQEAVKMKGGRLYWTLLDEFRKIGCFVGSAAQVSDWWADRSIPLTSEGDTIRLSGIKDQRLTLQLKTSGEKKIEAIGGSAVPSEDGYVVRAETSELVLRVS
jgi:hypothetical protein